MGDGFINIINDFLSCITNPLKCSPLLRQSHQLSSCECGEKLICLLGTEILEVSKHEEAATEILEVSRHDDGDTSDPDKHADVDDKDISTLSPSS